MTFQRSVLCAAILTLLTATPASAGIIMSFDPAAASVNVGEFVTVDIVANFDDPVVAWGLDLTIDEPTYADWTGTAIGIDWDSTTTIDGDGLAGLRFPDGLSGEVLLATLTFEGLAMGTTPLTLTGGVDEDEGFLLAAGGLETNVQFMPGSLTVVPEPAALLALGLLALYRRRCPALPQR